MCFYLRNWQVTFLLYTLGVKITEYIAKAPIEPRDYRVVFLIQQKTPDSRNGKLARQEQSLLCLITWNDNADAMLYLPGGGAMLFFN